MQCSRRALVAHERVSVSVSGRQIVISEGRYPGAAVIATVRCQSAVDVVVALALARRLARRAVHLHDDRLLADAYDWWERLRSVLQPDSLPDS